MQALLFCGIIYDIIYWRNLSMEDPGSQEILLEFILLIVLTLLNAFFSAAEMSMVSLNGATQPFLIHYSGGDHLD